MVLTFTTPPIITPEMTFQFQLKVLWDFTGRWNLMRNEIRVGFGEIDQIKKINKSLGKNFEWSVFKIIFYLPVSDSAKNDPSTQNRPDLKDSRASKCTSLHRNPRTPGSKKVRTCALNFVFVRMINFHQKIAFFAYAISRLAPFWWIVWCYRYYESQFTANKTNVHEWGWTLLFIYL